MRFHKFLVSITFLATLIGCDGSDTEAPPSPEQPAKAATPVEAPEEKAADGTRSFPNSTKTPLPFAVGQWTKHRYDHVGQPDSELTYKIVGKKGDAWWLEVEMSGDTPFATRMLVDVKDRTKPDSATIEEVIVRMPDGEELGMPDGKEQRMTGAVVKMVRKRYEKWSRGIAADFGVMTQRETVEVSAGTFKGAFYKDNIESFAGDARGKVWTHSAIPLMAMVKMEMNSGMKIELIDFGLSGAKSSFKTVD